MVLCPFVEMEESGGFRPNDLCLLKHVQVNCHDDIFFFVEDSCERRLSGWVSSLLLCVWN